jgi:Ser/Thr protein kinase RdoA (MazF antagonist)
VQAQDATTPQLLEVGRLLARLHLLGEAHPASIADPLEAPLLASRLPSGEAGEAGEALRDVLQAGLPPLPSGATHGGLSPAHVLFVGERASAVVPGGTSASAALLLDLAQAICGWALGLAAPLPAVRALLSGYQALRRLSLEERELLPQALRCAAARAGALQLLRGDAAHPLDALRACDALDARDLRAAAG